MSLFSSSFFLSERRDENLFLRFNSPEWPIYHVGAMALDSRKVSSPQRNGSAEMAQTSVLDKGSVLISTTIQVVYWIDLIFLLDLALEKILNFFHPSATITFAESVTFRPVTVSADMWWYLKRALQFLPGWSSMLHCIANEAWSRTH